MCALRRHPVAYKNVLVRAVRLLAQSVLTVLAWDGTALAAQTVVFRNGESPDPTYSGTQDARLYDGRNEPWEPNTNYDTDVLLAGGEPFDQAILVRWAISGVPTGAAVEAVELEFRGTAGALSDSYAIYA